MITNTRKSKADRRRKIKYATSRLSSPSSRKSVTASTMPGQFRKRVFNFSQLDAKAAELDLMVHASKKIQRTVGAISDQVTGAIEVAR